MLIYRLKMKICLSVNKQAVDLKSDSSYHFTRHMRVPPKSIIERVSNSDKENTFTCGYPFPGYELLYLLILSDKKVWSV